MTDISPRLAPLTAQQRGFWELYQLRVGGNFNICVGLRLLGGLSVDLLQRSLANVIARHGSLRTRITLVNGIPWQLIDCVGEFPFLAESVHGETKRANQIVDEFLSGSFDLPEGKLFRAKLLRLSDGEHILLILADHLVMDGFSVGILFDELWRCYGALSEGRRAELPMLTCQYADYASWQRLWRAEWFTKHAPYWRWRLANIEALRFPLHQCPKEELPAGVRAQPSLSSVRFDETLTAGLYAAARRLGAPPAMVMLTSFLTLLWGWSRQDDQIVQLLIAGRDDPDYSDTIGLFADGVPLRIEFTGEDRFIDVLARVMAEFCVAYENRGHGEPLLDDPVMLERVGRAVFNWVPASVEQHAGCPGPEASVQLKDTIRVEPLLLRSPNRFSEIDASSSFAIGFIWIFPGSALTATLMYNPYVFSTHSAARFIKDLFFVMEKFHSDPERLVLTTIDELPDGIEVSLIVRTPA